MKMIWEKQQGGLGAVCYKPEGAFDNRPFIVVRFRKPSTDDINAISTNIATMDNYNMTVLVEEGFLTTSQMSIILSAMSGKKQTTAILVNSKAALGATKMMEWKDNTVEFCPIISEDPAEDFANILGCFNGTLDRPISPEIEEVLRDLLGLSPAA